MLQVLEQLNGLFVTDMKPILVYGWYNKGNIGDDLFKEAFQSLFFNFSFIFTDNLTSDLLDQVSSVFIGGGSFLYAAPKMSKDVLDILKQKKLFYIGVGVETDIHPIHIELMRIAKFIAIRTPHRLSKIQEINKNTLVIPDIVYSLQSSIKKINKQPNSILIVPNYVLVPQWSDPHWKHVAWEYFKSEFSQFLDNLVEKNYIVKFFPMCQNAQSNDHWASIEILNKMKHRNENFLLPTAHNFDSVSTVFGQYETVITQRFHGIILSEIMKIPSIIISHHDKLNINNDVVPYYECSKIKLINKLNLVRSMNFSSILPIENNIFEELKQNVNKSLLNDG